MEAFKSAVWTREPLLNAIFVEVNSAALRFLGLRAGHVWFFPLQRNFAISVRAVKRKYGDSVTRTLYNSILVTAQRNHAQRRVASLLYGIN